MQCRGCDQEIHVEKHEFVTPLKDVFKCYLCSSCGVVSVPRQAIIYEELHSNPGSTYSHHSKNIERLLGLVKIGDLDGLSKALGEVRKRKWFLEHISNLPMESKVLEIGCSTGAVASFSIACGHDYLGADISSEAVKLATSVFGPYFSESNSDMYWNFQDVDLIYMIGTIGCLDDPVRMLEDGISRLRIGGKLVFNTPNYDLFMRSRVPWIYSTYPPDLVTVFPEEFWSRFSRRNLRVTVERDATTVSDLFRVWLREKSNWKYKKRESMWYSVGDEFSFWRRALRLVTEKLLGKRTTKCTSEFGVYVTFEKIS